MEYWETGDILVTRFPYETILLNCLKVVDKKIRPKWRGTFCLDLKLFSIETIFKYLKKKIFKYLLVRLSKSFSWKTDNWFMKGQEKSKLIDKI